MREAPIMMFVVPCYNEEEALSVTASTLRHKLLALKQNRSIGAASGIIFVDDGSTDATWSIIERLHDEDPDTMHGVKLAHNKGHQNALYAGLMQALHSGADVSVSMDADLQDDPDAVNQMIEEYRNGAEIVFGVRDNRDTDTAFKRGTAHAFYSFMRWLGTETVPDHADYRLMSHVAMEALSQYGEVNLFLRGIVPSLGFRTAKVYYKRGVRIAGESKYPLGKMVTFALEGITSFSTKPLSLIVTVGVLSVVIGVVMLAYTLVSVFTEHAVAGWGSLMCSLWFIGGFILMAIGIVGEYIGRIYLEVKARPRYIVEKSF